jgi:hypothetical protein
MKSCPKCHRTYSDNDAPFCTEDGTPLVSDAAYNPQQPPMPGAAYGNPPPSPQYAPQQYPPQQPWAPPARSGGNSKVIIGVVVGLLLLAGIGVGIYLLTRSSDSSTSSSTSTGASGSPTAAYQELYAAAQKRDGAGVKKRLSKEFLDSSEQQAKTANLSLEDYLSKILSKVFSDGYTSETRNEKVTGDTATIEVKETKGTWIPAYFAKEDGLWKLLPK